MKNRGRKSRDTVPLQILKYMYNGHCTLYTVANAQAYCNVCEKQKVQF